MKTKRFEYKLSQTAMKSVDNQTDVNQILDLNRKKNAKKGNSLVMINQSTSILNYIVPIFHKNNFFAGKMPQPSALFLAQAIENEKKVIEILDTFPSRVYSSSQQSSNSESKINFVNDSDYDLFLMYKIGSITALVTTIECFVNEIIPEDMVANNSKNKPVGKKEIERFWDLKSKLQIVVPSIRIIKNEEKYERLTNKFLELSKIRNDFIHLKTSQNGKNLDPFIDRFEELINLDLSEKIKDTKSLMTIIDSTYF